MRFDAAEAVARAALYEGYLLYPYRASSVKNRRRWNFGVLEPRASADEKAGERWRAFVQCAARAPRDARLTVEARFLTAASRSEGAGGQAADASEGLQRAVERRVVLDSRVISDFERSSYVVGFSFDDSSEDVEGVRYVCRSLRGALRVSVERLPSGACAVTAQLSNLSDSNEGDAPHARALLSAHVLLGLEGGLFASPLDPPRELQAAVGRCRSEGLWPVLVGGEREAPVMLASPVILYDDPKVAPESAGDLFDATEIDEILSLRVLTLSESEKEELRAGDPRARALLERTERLAPEDWARLHGALRRP